MRLQEFMVGKTFWTVTGEWRCTDVGSRVVVAIKLDHPEDPSWYDGPPYGVAETVFNEHDLGGCYPNRIVSPPISARRPRWTLILRCFGRSPQGPKRP
jgi:hypothetical protein